MKLNYFKPIISVSAVIATSPVLNGEPCPDPWVVYTRYEEGDEVGARGNVYRCKEWPYSAQCGQAGFEPGVNPFGVEQPNWESAWTLGEPCVSPIAPIPHFDPHVIYDYGDMVINVDHVWKCY